jgi:GcrA cell cycle regulator
VAAPFGEAMNALVSTGRGYTTEEVVKVAGWLRDGLSASQIAAKLTDLRHGRNPVSRNAAIGLVHRNKALKAIGFANVRPAAFAAASKTRRRASRPTSNPAFLPARMFARVDVPKPEAALSEFKVRQPKTPLVLPPKVATAGIRFLDALFGKCRWPLDLSLDAPKTADLIVCGLPVEEGNSFCPRCRIRSFARGTSLFAAELASAG